MALLSGVVSLHDVDDVEGLARRALDDSITSWGARLSALDYEDAMSYLLEVMVRLAGSYDPAKGRNSFSTFAYRILRRRVVDWYREAKGDARYGHHKRIVAISDEERSRIEAEILESWDGWSVEEVLAMVNTVALNPGPRRVWNKVVVPIVRDGRTISEVARDLDVPRSMVVQQLEELTAEIREKGLIAA